MDKNPFSLYDFLGYVFPGAIALLFINFFHEQKSGCSLYLLCSSIINNDSKILTLTWDNLLLFILVSYILGHLIAYLSSLTVEQFAIWQFGYPSDFLLNKRTPNLYWRSINVPLDNTRKFPLNYQKYSVFIRYLWRLLVGLFLCSLVIFHFIIGKIFGVKHLVIKQLDMYTIEQIHSKCYKLAKLLDLDSPAGHDIDFHRIINHYIYENQTNHIKKMDNYVALYGFLRSLTFIFNIVFVRMFIINVMPTIELRNSIDCQLLSQWLVLGVLAYLYYMGFLKFYRRYTLESFMCLLTDCKLSESGK